MSILIDRLCEAIRAAAAFNPEIQVAPACILWPDRDRQWEPVIQRLQGELSELLVLGEYDPDKKVGPAIWLRCVLTGQTNDISMPDDRLPIFYLPGISRQDLRAIESCPDHLKPLAELQYRGVIWSQLNAKDWTILAFLKSDQGGLELDVAKDNDSKNAMQLALYRLLDEEIELLKGKRLDKDYFNTLLTSGDPVRDLLQWLDQGEDFRRIWGDNEWKAFVEVCKSQLAFNPENDGSLVGAERLATHAGPWKSVWERYCEAPKRYPNIPGQIRKCKTPPENLFSNAESHGSWPQWNEKRENSLRKDLLNLKNEPAHKACEKILFIENQHGERRQLIWSELGEAPLAFALEHLTILADTTKNDLAAGSTEDLVNSYSNTGWHADCAVLAALACVETQGDFEAIKTAIKSVYLPWVQDSARYLQEIVDNSGYPGGSINSGKQHPCKESVCFLFVDGLRFDVAKRLVGFLAARGFEVEEKYSWAALPSVTATGKPAVTPVKNQVFGKDFNADFEPCVAATGQSLKGGYHLKKLMESENWQVLDRDEIGNGKGNAWSEFGNIDHEGHIRGWKLVKQLDSMLQEIDERISSLILSGWKTIRVVTDHGWLLMPGGLPKTDLPVALTENKWGRCAALKTGASTEERLFPWYWNTNQHFVLADGISCFRKGEEYAHGGLSLQECLTLELNVTGGSSATSTVLIKFTDVVWKGLRCSLAVDGQFAGLSLDIRLQPGNKKSSVILAKKAKLLKDNGTVSVVVEDEEFEGEEASIILLNVKGELVAQLSTIIGGGEQ